MRRALEAYAAGVNAFLATRRGALPPEFQLLRFCAGAVAPGRQPRLGQADGSGAGRQLPRRIAAGPPCPQLVARAACLSLSRITRKKRRPRWRNWRRSTAVCRSIRSMPASPPEIGPTYASNNWVVDGAHSASGKPLLANDPHLGFCRARGLVSGAPQNAGARDRRRHGPGRAACRHRPQRPDRLGLYDDGQRCRGPVHRKARSRTTPDAI